MIVIIAPNHDVAEYFCRMANIDYRREVRVVTCLDDLERIRGIEFHHVLTLKYWWTIEGAEQIMAACEAGVRR